MKNSALPNEDINLSQTDVDSTFILKYIDIETIPHTHTQLLSLYC